MIQSPGVITEIRCGDGEAFGDTESRGTEIRCGEAFGDPESRGSEIRFLALIFLFGSFKLDRYYRAKDRRGTLG